MTWVPDNPVDRRGDLRRVRLSQWAREEGIARITAYRMLRRGILPVPSERSPTGRWYVLLPRKLTGRMAFYARASPGPHQAVMINEQIDVLTNWAAPLRQGNFVVVREIADAYLAPMPKLARLLQDRGISDIVIESTAVVGEYKYGLLVAALVPQGRSIIAVNKKRQVRGINHEDARATIMSLCRAMYGPEKGAAAARRALQPDGGA